MKEFFQILFLVMFLIAAAVIMVVNAGWATTLFLLGVIAVPIIIFGVLPRLLGSRSGGSGKSGYYFSYDYKFGAKRPPES